MGFHCYLIQISERKLMDLDEADVPGLFSDAIGQSLGGSLATILVHEAAAGSRLPIPPLHLEERWLLLHWFLTEKAAENPEEVDEASPLWRAILGGKEIGGELMQGSAQYLWADEVREISDALGGLTRERLRKQFEEPSESMQKLRKECLRWYFEEDDSDDTVFNAFYRDFEILAAYYRIAAARGLAMLLGLT